MVPAVTEIQPYLAYQSQLRLGFCLEGEDRGLALNNLSKGIIYLRIALYYELFCIFKKFLLVLSR